MHEKIKHVNSLGETLDFNKIGILINYNDLRDFNWNVHSNNNKISSFNKGIVTKTIPFVFACTAEKANEIKNIFFEHFEIDVLNEKAGYFEINGYRLYGYVTGNKKSNYLIHKGYLDLEIELTCEDPSWTRTKKFVFTDDSTTISDEIHSKIYPHPYPFKYKGNTKTKTIINDALGTSDIVIRVPGPCINPLVKIGDASYQVMISVENQHYIEINTAHRTIFSYDSKGTKLNIFDCRNKADANFFKKIKNGMLDVTSELSSFEIFVIEKRSEPKWI